MLVDNYQGMRDAVCHLIEYHGYRRIAFLQRARGRAGGGAALPGLPGYADRPRPPPWQPNAFPVTPSGIAATARFRIADFLDARGLRPKIDFDAIISVGDDMACGALETLQTRGILVPEDVAVVGFNDDDEGRAILPALTTVRQPVEKMAQTAVSTLMALLSTSQRPSSSSLPWNWSCAGRVVASPRRAPHGRPRGYDPIPQKLLGQLVN